MLLLSHKNIIQISPHIQVNKLKKQQEEMYHKKNYLGYKNKFIRDARDPLAALPACTTQFFFQS